MSQASGADNEAVQVRMCSSAMHEGKERKGSGVGGKVLRTTKAGSEVLRNV